MNFLKTVLVGFLISHNALAGLPPTTAKGQGGSSSVSFETQAPFSQITKTDSVKALVETGNTNIIANPGFEAVSETTGWTASGGTYALTTTAANVGSGINAASWDSSSASQTLTSTAVTVPAGDYNSNYEVSANLKCATGTCTHTIQAYDGSNIIASKIITSSLIYSRSELNFAAPSSGSLSARVVSVASNEPTLYVDDVYLGRARNIGSVAQARLVGTLKSAGTTSCRWTQTSTSMASFPVDNDCPTPSVTGELTAPGTKLPAAVLASASSKTYKVTAIFTASSSGGPGACYYELYDGTSSFGASDTVATNQVTTLVGIFSYTSAASRTFEIRSQRTGGTSCEIFNTVSPNSLQFIVEELPSASETVYRPELTNLVASAYHSNNCGWARSNAAYGDPAGDSTCTFTQVVNSNGNITSALSGSDPLPGIIVTPNTAGTYKVCVNGASFSTGSGVGAVQLLNSTNSVQLGEISSTTYTRIPFYMCGLVQASSTSPVTVKLQIRNTAAANADIDVNTSASDRNLYWTVEKITQNTPSPVLVGSRAQVSVSTGNGFGSTNTKVRRFSTTDYSLGSNITYTDSSTLGGTFTANAPGVYTACYSDGQVSGQPYIGIVVNGTALTTSVATSAPARLTYAQGLRAVTRQQDTGQISQTICWTGNLNAGDIVYPQSDGAPDSSSIWAEFNIVQVSN